MPRQSPYSIMLSKAERAELLARSRRYTSRYRDVVRARIILLASEGISNRTIAARFDTPRQIASKWRRRFHLQRLAGLEEHPRGGRPARFSPPVSWSKSRRSPVSCRRGAACRWRAGRSASCAARPWPAVWWLRSAGRRCGVGSVMTRCGHGGIVVGYSRVTRLSPLRLAGCWTSISAAGRRKPWEAAITWCVPTKKPASKPAGANIPPFTLPRGGRSMSNMNMAAPAPGPISRPGMCTAPRCSAVANARPASRLLCASSLKSCAKSRTGLPAACLDRR
jgi:transposase